MDVLSFFIGAAIVFLLAMLFGGTMIGYYFQKKHEYEKWKFELMGTALKAVKKQQNE